MKNIITITLKEIKSYLLSPIFCIVIAIFLSLCGFLFSSSPFTYSETSIGGFLNTGCLLLLLLIAVLTMRIVAEEKKLGTMELLLTAPVKDIEIVLGKFFGSFGIIIIILILTLFFPVLLFVYGDPDIGPFATGYLGLILLSGASLAVGIFASSITSSQIAAAVITGGILFGFWFMGTAAVYLPKAFASAVGFFSFSGYFADFTRGIIDTRAIVYFISVTVLFLFMATRSIENSRWN